MHRVIASITAPTAAAAAAAVRALPPEATTAEIRLDALWPTAPDPQAAAADLALLADAADATHGPDGPVELLFTLRPVGEGGKHTGDEALRLNLLAGAGRAASQFIDLELGSAVAPVTTTLQADGTKYFVSRHWEGPVPSREAGLRALLAMQDHRAEGEKLALRIGSFADELRALELCRLHAQRHGNPLVTPMGGGPHLRALLAVVGNTGTYGHPPGLPPAADGQPGLDAIVSTWRHWGLARTDLQARDQPPRPWLAVLGHPVAHSLSPRLHNTHLRELGRPERFVALDVPASAAALRLALMVAGRTGMVGASVTAPHKEDAARIAQPDAVAKAVGAANCLRAEGETYVATNTDATAIRRVLAEHIDANAPCVVIGSGGAARAALWAARELGAVVHFTSRDPTRAERLAKELGATWTPWERRSRLSGQAWIQATPVGATPGDPAPVAAAQLKGRPVCIELAYAAGPTAFEREARQAGCPVVDGRRMLLEQALDSHRHWFGQEPRREVMEAAA